MEAEILNQPPMSGDYEEHSFYMSGNSVWVKFFDEDYLEWVGVFSQGAWSSLNTVFRVPGEKLFLVVAGGQGYFVDPNARNVVATIERDGITSIVCNEETGILVATDGLHLILFQGPELLWSSERISADGISFTEQYGSIVQGILNDLTDQGCEFSFNVSTREVKAAWIFAESWG